MKAADKLRARWSRSENDLEVAYPLGSQARPDCAYLLTALGPIIAELERRGYDKRTLRVSIEPTAGNERFASQRAAPPADPDHEGAP